MGVGGVTYAATIIAQCAGGWSSAKSACRKKYKRRSTTPSMAGLLISITRRFRRDRSLANRAWRSSAMSSLQAPMPKYAQHGAPLSAARTGAGEPTRWEYFDFHSAEDLRMLSGTSATRSRRIGYCWLPQPHGVSNGASRSRCRRFSASLRSSRTVSLRHSTSAYSNCISLVKPRHSSRKDVRERPVAFLLRMKFRHVWFGEIESALSTRPVACCEMRQRASTLPAWWTSRPRGSRPSLQRT